ncbi:MULTISPECIES: hypothetical protein [unclassified Mycobacterium]|uniref:hypothetical protein n=1 Tax=unclassified Mycobacterium TaxID=2642494 RepID=UPI0029C640E9|nr:MULTISPECIES: hypothetical protein [unclassified Mycobacterium]
MTEPEDHSSTRPISVAELLARNGSIGAPPVGGRRRRRRGDSNSVTVAELTGEIPIITDATHVPDEDEPAEEPASTNGAAEHVESIDVAEPVEAEEPAEVTDEVEAIDVEETSETTPEPVVTEAEADYEAHLEQRDAEVDPVEFTPPPRRAPVATPPAFSGPAGGAEQMSPDPVVDDDIDDDEHDGDLIESLKGEAPLSAADDATQAAFEVPSYLRSNSDTLFGGQSVADDLARRGRQPGPEDIDLGEDERPDVEASEDVKPQGSSFLRGVWVVAQCILAVVFGAGLFIAFDLLWNWNNIVALVLAVLVILGLVVGVRVVRKTEDIGSTLIAVAVGALVTLGPLVLLKTH